MIKIVYLQMKNLLTGITKTFTMTTGNTCKIEIDNINVDIKLLFCVPSFPTIAHFTHKSVI